MIVYVNVYPEVAGGFEKPCLRTFTTVGQALYQRLEGCLGTWMINTITKESKEIVPAIFSLST